MELVHQEAITAEIALGALSFKPSIEKPVYNPTTLPNEAAAQTLTRNVATSTIDTPVTTTPSQIEASNNKVPQIELNNMRAITSGPPEEFVHPIEEDMELLSSLPRRTPVDLEFKELQYTVSVGIRQERKEILHNVNGKFPGNQLIAIMGPSGAGKSTLLDVLSSFKTTGVSGEVLTNGRRRVLNNFRRMSCYIMQDDRLQPLLTVEEHMRMAASLKLGSNIEYHVKHHRIEEILLLLKLYGVGRTLIKNLSGGQKKRLSIALEMLSNPTIMFLDEPTTGLDSYSCNKVMDCMKKLAEQGRSVICTIHQPSAKLFQEFDQVYILASGECIYQGSPNKLIPFLENVELFCPQYHNPADYVIEIACEEYGRDPVDLLVNAMGNGRSIEWFTDPSKILKSEQLIRKYPMTKRSKNQSLEDTTFVNQVNVLLKYGVVKAKRDLTLTHLRIAVNIFLAIMLGFLYVEAGNDASRVLDNYNLLFAILMHHSMTTMMLTVLTFPCEMQILLKEHFNRWYSLKAYFVSVNVLDFPISLVCCIIFTVMIYFLSYQPMEWFRFGMFFTISMLVVFVGQSIGLMIGSWFSVVNGTFLAPVLTIPMMMFAGFGVTLRDMPDHLKWGSYISYLRYGLEGYVGAIYGENRTVLDCNLQVYCHYRYPQKFLAEITMRGDQFWNDVTALVIIVIIFRSCSYILLRMKINSVK